MVLKVLIIKFWKVGVDFSKELIEKNNSSML